MSLSIEHEAPIELCREHPQVVLSILKRLLHLEVPSFSSLRVTDPNSRQTQVTGYRADNAFIFEQHDRPVVAVVVEPQRSVNDRKRYSWPKYTADVHAEVCCTTYLIVLALTPAVARWARVPIETFQPGTRFAPHVIGPDEVPKVASLEQAREDPWLAALAALLHANEDQGEQEVLRTLQVTQETAGPDQAWWLYQLIRAIMTPERCEVLQELIMLNPDAYLPKTKYERQQWAGGKAEGKTEGKTEAKAEAVLTILKLRRVEVSETDRARIMGEKDLDVLERWLARAISATSAGEVLAQG